MARKLPGLQRILGPEALYAVVYGEISSSLYFALGVVSLWALGLTPLVLLGVGLLFGLAAGAYAEAAMLQEDATGPSTVVRRAFGDLAGFVVGWAVLLDLVVVIALSLLFVPHYALAAVGEISRVHHPADELIAVALVLALASFRLVRRSQIHRIAVFVAAVDLVVQLLLAVMGVALVLDVHALTKPLHVGSMPTWNAVAYSIPIAMIAFTGLEIVSYLLREAKEPATALARGTIAAVVSTVALYALIAAAALSAFPVHPVRGTPSGAASDISTRWINAPLAGLAKAVGDQIDANVGSGLRLLVGVSAVLVLLFNAASAFSGATRVLKVLGDSQSLPAVLTRQSRRSGSAPASVLLIAVAVAVILPIASLFDREVTALASIYSFGILISFMAVFLGIVWLRFSEPDADRPIMMRGNVRFGTSLVPVGALIGFALSWLTWVLTLGTHRAARIVPPVWLLGGIALFVLTRRARGMPLMARYRSTPPPPPEISEVPYGVIVVPVKQAGPIEEEMLATACKLALEQSASVLALKVIEVPLDLPIDAPLPEEERRGESCIALAATFATDYGVDVQAKVVRSRAISGTVVAEATAAGAGLILVGAVPHIGREAGRSHVFSPTIENLLRRAHTRVIVTAFPPGTASVAEPEPASEHTP